MSTGRIIFVEVREDEATLELEGESGDVESGESAVILIEADIISVEDIDDDDADTVTDEDADAVSVALRAVDTNENESAETWL